MQYMYQFKICSNNDVEIHKQTEIHTQTDFKRRSLKQLLPIKLTLFIKTKFVFNPIQTGLFLVFSDRGGADSAPPPPP